MTDPMTDEQRDEALANRPSPHHVSLDSIKAKVAEAAYVWEGVLTIAILTLENGYVVTGQSACADPANYDQELGQKLAYDDAVKKVWPLEGYLLREKLHQGELRAEAQDGLTRA